MNEHRDASNRLTFDFDSIPSGMYRKIVKDVIENFDLSPENKCTKGLDEIFQEFSTQGNIIGLEWDNWSGFIVNAKSPNSENLAKNIAVYINGKYAT